MLLTLILLLSIGALPLEKVVQHANKEVTSYKEALTHIHEASKNQAELHKNEVLKAVEASSKGITPPKSCSLSPSQNGRCSLANTPLHKPELPELVVFVSSTLPQNALKQLALESKKIKTRFVIKGLVNNSFQETAALVKACGVALDIDPLLFEELTITQVPVFAYKAGEDWHCLRGNVTLSFAFKKLKGAA